MLDQIAIGAGIAGCVVGLISVYRSTHRWWILPGKANPSGQFAREKRYCTMGPNGLPIAPTDDEIARLERAYKRLSHE
jgi:hypothetical protein